MKKEAVKKHLPFKTILIILFLGSLVYATYEAYGPFNEFDLNNKTAKTKEQYPEYFDYGTIADSTYCNDFFRFRIPVSKGYQYDYKIYDFKNSTIYERDLILAKPRLASAITEHDLLIITPELLKIDVQDILGKRASTQEWLDYSSKKRKREFHGPEYCLIIRAYNLSGKALGTYTSELSNIHNPDNGDSQTKLISGIQFREFEGEESQDTIESRVAFQILGGKNQNIISFMTEINDFAFSINLFYQTEEQKHILLEMANMISFH